MHKILKVQISLTPHSELSLGTHQSWSRELRGNVCYSSLCLTADSCLAAPSAMGGGKGGQSGPIM